MTPTLLGRIQTRILLFVIVGLPITLVFGLWLVDWSWPPAPVPFIFLGTLLLVGLLLDPVYIFIQSFRWDQDWPFAFQFLFTIVEFLIVLLIIYLDLHPWLLPVAVTSAEALWLTTLHFTLVFIASFLALLGGLQILLVRWRFKAGELGRL
jgi:hypothetical protein